MRGYGPGPALSEEQALDAFLRSLNVAPDLIPIDVEERASLYRSLIGNKRMLVIIDNVTSAKQVRYLLPGPRRCFALVTSRGSLSSLVAREGATRVTLDVLSPADAVTLIAEVIGEERVDAEYEAAAQIAQLCSYLPLALRVVAERAAGRPYLSLTELAGELVSEQSRLDALASEEDQLTDVRAVFSWSYRALSPDQQKVFRAIGLHAGPEFGSAAAAALVDLSVSATNHQLQELARVHLVQEVAVDRYRSHDLLHAYSVERGQREDRQRARTHAIRRMLSWYMVTADLARQVILPYSQSIALVPPERLSIPSFDSVASAMSWYELERLNILSALQQAMDLGQYDIAWKLPVISDGFFELRSYWKEWQVIHREGLSAALIVGDSLGEASSRRCLGDACWRLGDYDEALVQYERGAAIAHVIGDQWIEGFSVRGAGLIHEELRNFNRAIEYFEQARQVFEAGGIERGLGMSLLSLGKSCRSLRDLRRAAQYCEMAAATFRRIDDRWSQAWGLGPLGEVYLEMGRFEAAQQQFEEALAIFREFGDRRSEALVLRQLGDVFQRSGGDRRARECWENALEIFESLGDPHSDEIRLLLRANQGG
jgi:tetratricopeptide (TPR) repeat protein